MILTPNNVVLASATRRKIVVSNCGGGTTGPSGLTSVAVDGTTITGNGTVGDPLVSHCDHVCTATGDGAPGVVLVTIKGGAFADTDVIQPRLHLMIKFYSDLNFSQIVGQFNTSDATFHPYCRVLDHRDGRVLQFSEPELSGGIQAWYDYDLNQFSQPEKTPHGFTNSQVSVNVDGLISAEKVSAAPRTWAATFIDMREEPYAPGMWEFGAV